MTRLRLASAETFRSLSIRSFRLFFVGQSISQIGNWLTLIAQTLLVLELTDSGVALGWLAAAQFGPVLLFGAFAGLVADRSDKRRLLIGIQAFAMLQSFALAALAFQDHPPVWAIYVIAVFGGMATAFDNPARRSFVVEMVPEDHVTNAVSLNSALMTGSRIIGPALGGFLVVTVGFGWAFLVDGISYVAVIAGLRMIDPRSIRPAPVTPRGRGQVRAGFAYAWSVAELRVPLLMMAVIGTLAFNFQTVLPLFAVRDLGGRDLTFSLLMSVVSVGSLLGALRSARRRDVSVRTVSLSAIGFGASMLALAAAPSQPVAFAIGALMAFTSISFMTAGCWRCRRWCSSAAPRSADPSWGPCRSGRGLATAWPSAEPPPWPPPPTAWPSCDETAGWRSPRTPSPRRPPTPCRAWALGRWRCVRPSPSRPPEPGAQEQRVASSTRVTSRRRSSMASTVRPTDSRSSRS